MRRSLKLAAVGAAAALVLTGCAKEFDIQGTGAIQVPGSGGIYRFCDGPTLIYFTSRSGSEDELEAIWPDMCEPENGKWVYSTDADDYTEPAEPRVDGNVPDDGN